MKHSLILILILSLYACDSARTEENILQDRLNAIIAEVDSTSQFNGIVGVLRKDEKPVVIYHGYKSPIDQNSKLDSTDYFHIASNSKLFTGISTLKMMEQYDLKFSDSIGPYFPELHQNLGKVTIQQLANHTCAIHDYFSLIEDPVEVTNEQALILISQLDSTVYEPGTRWGYTNSGYVLLSLLVERVAAIPYNEFLTQEVLLPLGIEDAQLHPNKIAALQGFENNASSKILSVTTGGSGIYLTAKDLITFFDNQDKISKYTDQAKEWSSPWHDDQWRYGFGWFFSEDSLGTFRDHSGKSGGFESYIRVYDSHDLMIFILSNHVNGSAKILRERVIEQLNTGAK